MIFTHQVIYKIEKKLFTAKTNYCLTTIKKKVNEQRTPVCNLKLLH